MLSRSDLAARALWACLTSPQQQLIDERFFQQVLLAGLQYVPGLGAGCFAASDRTKWWSAAQDWADLLGYDGVDNSGRAFETHVVEVKMAYGKINKGESDYQLDKYVEKSRDGTKFFICAPEKWLVKEGFSKQSSEGSQYSLSGRVRHWQSWTPVSFETVRQFLDRALTQEQKSLDDFTRLIIGYARAEVE